MASGDTLFVFTPKDNVPPASNFATLDTFAAATGFREVLDFDGTANDETAIFSGVWPSNYAGGGIDVIIHYSLDGVDPQAVQFEVSAEVVQDDDDQDEDGKKKVKKKSPKWSFSFGVIDEDDDPIEFGKGSDEIELIESIAENFEILDDLLKTSVLLGRELAKNQKDEAISEKIDRLNLMIEKIARARGLKKGSGNNNDRLWSFSLARDPDEDDE